MLACAGLMLTCSPALAEDAVAGDAKPTDDVLTKAEKSPWLLLPTFQGNPKLGAAFGALAGYMHYFDKQSRPSIFAVTAQYTSTDSVVGGLFAKTSFDRDHQRFLTGLAYGKIKNDYDDFLGTGVPLHNDAELKSLIARYTYRVQGDWFIGGQGLYQDFAIDGDTDFDDAFMGILGIAPFKTAGAGLVLQNDTRDNENMPTQGWLLNANNIFFREGLGGDHDYEVYRLDLRYYLGHGNGHVLAFHQLNHLTDDAPGAARAPVQLRGYKVGQYTSRYMSSLEVEERFRFASKFTASLFAGGGWLYGDERNTADDFYPAGGGGVQYILKPKEGIVLNLEAALGKDDNYGFYLKLGYAF
jgi:outer membrane protein assembly factor BamA